MYETFDHTADLGLRVRAADLNTLFAEAGLALECTLVENLDAVEGTRTVEIVLPADDLDYLLFDWLKALLYHFDVGRMVFGRFDVTVDGTGVRATCHGEPLDRSRHEAGHEVKAITYHELKVEQTTDGWLAEVIVDI